MSTYFIVRNGDRHGPFTAEEIEGKIRGAELSFYDLCWEEGMSDWAPIAETITFKNLAVPPNPPVSPPHVSESSVSYPGKQPMLPVILVVFLAIIAVGLMPTCSEEVDSELSHKSENTYSSDSDNVYRDTYETLRRLGVSGGEPDLSSYEGPCSRCRGSGQRPSGRCSSCRGDGTIHTRSGYITVCPSCQGNGHGYMAKCYSCDGTGRSIEMR